MVLLGQMVPHAVVLGKAGMVVSLCSRVIWGGKHCCDMLTASMRGRDARLGSFHCVEQ